MKSEESLKLASDGMKAVLFARLYPQATRVMQQAITPEDMRLVALMDWSHGAYNVDMKAPKFARKVSVLWLASLRDKHAVKQLRRLIGDMPTQKRTVLCYAFQYAADKLKQAYHAKVNEAAQAVWGRDALPQDYKISCIWSEEFQPLHKDELRELNNVGQACDYIAWVWAYWAQHYKDA